MKYNLDEAIAVAVGLPADDYVTDGVAGDAINIREYAEALIVLNAGLAVVGAEVDVTVEGSANGSTGWTAITGAAFDSITTSNDNTVHVGRINLRNLTTYKYIRVAIDAATGGTSGGLTCSATVLLGGARSLPVTQANAVAFTV